MHTLVNIKAADTFAFSFLSHYKTHIYMYSRALVGIFYLSAAIATKDV